MWSKPLGGNRLLHVVDVSVCIPTYDSAKTLGICLDSIFRQTVKPKEVLICDGGSHDETLKIVEAYPVELVAKNVKGVGAARNILTSASSGKLIAWIDADAAIPPNWLELRVKSHQTQLDADCLSGPAMVVSIEDGKRLSRQTLNVQTLKLRLSNIISWTAVTMRRQTIEDVGGFDPIFEFDGDWDLTTRLIRADAGLYRCDECPAYHVRPEKVMRWGPKKCVLGGNFVLYLLKYGPEYIKFNPKHFVTFILRMWLLYSLLILPFFSELMLPSLLVAIAFNLIGEKLHTNELRLGYLLEQLFKAVGEHRNLVRYLKSRLSHKTVVSIADLRREWCYEAKQPIASSFHHKEECMVIHAHTKLTKNMKILDAGCGKARTDVELAKHGAEVVVLDVSKSAINQAKINIKHYGVSIDTVIGDLMHMPIKSNIFDLVWNEGVIEHLKSPIDALLEMVRVTKKGRNVSVIVPNKFTIWRFVWGIKQVVGRAHKGRGVTSLELKKLFRKAGLTHIDTYSIHLLPWGVLQKLGLENMYRTIEKSRCFLHTIFGLQTIGVGRK